jgi:CheY-like chemotaxis protein
LKEGDPFKLVLIDGGLRGDRGFAIVEQLRALSATPAVTIMMLGSIDPNGDAKRCRDLGIEHHVNKPISQSSLWKALVSAGRGPKPLENRAAGEEPVADRAIPFRQARILLAEDNKVNQRVATSLLEKEGYSVVVAANGKEAVAAFESERFDLVLMDMQMPEMDGFEATATIRRREKPGCRIPIVALTAHALKGDRKRCLECGMDDYLSKPINRRDLLEKVGHFTTAGRAEPLNLHP